MKRYRRWLLVLPVALFAIAAFACGGDGADDDVPEGLRDRGYAHPERLVTAAWLQANLDDESIRIIDLRSEEDFATAHIPGAIQLTPGTTFQATDENGIDGQIPSAAAIAVSLGAAGMAPADTIIFYDGINSLWSSRALWVLDVYGHEDSRILDGAWKVWEAGGRPTETGAVTPVSAVYAVPTTRNSALVADWQLVLDSIDDEDTAVLDARGPEEYAGRDVRADRGGHVPGAINVNWTSNVEESGEFKSAADLEALYAAAGLTGDESGTATYCQTGVRAAHTWFVLSQLLGYDNVSNYDGSWTEWGNSEDLPIER